MSRIVLELTGLVEIILVIIYKWREWRALHDWDWSQNSGP